MTSAAVMYSVDRTTLIRDDVTVPYHHLLLSRLPQPSFGIGGDEGRPTARKGGGRRSHQQQQLSYCCLPRGCKLQSDAPILSSVGQHSVHIICSNPSCLVDQWMHINCYTSWERRLLVGFTDCSSLRSNESLESSNQSASRRTFREVMARDSTCVHCGQGILSRRPYDSVYQDRGSEPCTISGTIHAQSPVPSIYNLSGLVQPATNASHRITDNTCRITHSDNSNVFSIHSTCTNTPMRCCAPSSHTTSPMCTSSSGSKSSTTWMMCTGAPGAGSLSSQTMEVQQKDSHLTLRAHGTSASLVKDFAPVAPFHGTASSYSVPLSVPFNAASVASLAASTASALSTTVGSSIQECVSSLISNRSTTCSGDVRLQCPTLSISSNLGPVDFFSLVSSSSSSSSSSKHSPLHSSPLRTGRSSPRAPLYNTSTTGSSYTSTKVASNNDPQQSAGGGGGRRAEDVRGGEFRGIDKETDGREKGIKKEASRKGLLIEISARKNGIPQTEEKDEDHEEVDRLRALSFSSDSTSIGRICNESLCQSSINHLSTLVSSSPRSQHLSPDTADLSTAPPPASVPPLQLGNMFQHRTDLAAFEALPRAAQNTYHMRVEDDGPHGNDQTRRALLKSLTHDKVKELTCVVCSSRLPIFDEFPLVNGTLFLSPKAYNSDIKVQFGSRSCIYLNALCLSCLSGSQHSRLTCLSCHTEWYGSNFIIGTLYFYDILAAVPCCLSRLACTSCSRPVNDTLPRYFSDSCQLIECPYCHTKDYHVCKPLSEIFHLNQGFAHTITKPSTHHAATQRTSVQPSCYD